jgi:glycosyltransferase involved in cell wall biosynthesis
MRIGRVNLRVCQICHRYYPFFGGIETYVMEVSVRLAKRGYEVEVLTTDPIGRLAKEEIVNGVKVTRFRAWAPNEAYYFSSSLCNHLGANSEKYDILHAHNYHAFPALYAAWKKGANKLVFNPHYHGTGHTPFRRLLHIPYRLVSRSIFEKADRIVCVSKFEKELITRIFKVPLGKMALVPNGLDLEDFKNLKRTYDVGKRVLYVGRLEKYKRVDRLLGAMRYLDQDFSLDVVGSGPAKKSLEELSDKLGLHERVRFHESLPRSRLLTIYSRASVFVTLSTHEAYGIAVAEALAAGIPCIVANSSALAEWVDDQNCIGLNDPLDLAEVSRQIKSAVGKRVQNINSRDWDEVCESMINVYRSVCSQ